MLCALLATVAATAVLLPREEVPTGPTPGGGASTGTTGRGEVSTGRDRAARALLGRLERYLDVGGADALAAVSGAAGAAGAAGSSGDPVRELRTLRHNVRAVGLSGPRWRYLGAQPQRGPVLRRRGSGAGAPWLATVRVTWRVRGSDDRPSSQDVTMTFRDVPGDPRRAVFVTARDGYGRGVPLWLLDRVLVARAGRVVVVSASPTTTASRLARTVVRAAGDVRAVLPRWRARVVVEVPRDEAALAEVLGAEPGRYAGVAAVAATPGGSRSSRVPVRVLVNPDVLGRLGPRAARIVLAHEMTHVATRAPAASMPTWLVEGFADYVALAGADLPVAVSATQALAEVRRTGAPGRLPGAADFTPGSPRLGASYEGAWLAARLLARSYGERALVRFYRQVARESSTVAAFGRLGTNERAFTRRWRAELTGLAR